MSDSTNHNPVRQLNAEVARKIAAGEVIDRPNAIVRELLDNAVDSGATKISVELTEGGIEKIRVADNGCGMTKDDLENCARPHATSKISSADDLLKLTTLGFRGEALASMAAVSRLTIRSGAWTMNASVTQDHVLSASTPVTGTIVQTAGLFENFPARRQFLKRPASEGIMCRSTFEEKAIARPDISFSLTMDGVEKITLSAGQSLKQRFCEALELFEEENLFYEVTGKASDGTWSFTLVIGEPSVSRSSRKNIYIYVNGRRIQEYSLIQAIEYGAQGFFPNGTHPVACLFVNMDSSLVDFNIHPAKREARFKDIAALHHSVSTTTREFFRKYTAERIISSGDTTELTAENLSLGFTSSDNDTDTGADTTKDSGTYSDSPSYTALSTFTGSQTYTSTRTNTTPGSFSGGHTHTGSHSPSGFKNIRSGNSSYAAKNLAELLISEPDEDEASVEGRTTKPNYFSPKTDSTEDDGFHFVGITLGTFLIAEKNDVLYIIDQHAAHERYLYNKIMADAGQKQTLLVPYVIQTESEADDNFLAELTDALSSCGFTGKNCGNGRWEFTTVPIRWRGTEEDLKKDLLDKRINPKDMINAVAASTACRSAVMDGTVLDTGTAEWIAREALKLPDPHCPHGRPVYTTITRRQLFSLVKRI